MESPNSSAFSVTSAPSVISDIYDIGAHTENGNSDGQDSSDCAPSALDKVSKIPEHNGKPWIEPGGGDATIEINGTRFEVHKYLLKRFAVLENELNGQAPEAILSIRGGECIVEDFRNTFKVLYATVLEGPFDFDKSILVSALRIATAYGYPYLRTYVINRLKIAKLTAIERIKIGREFGFLAFEESGYIELCERDEPISKEEAKILGMVTSGLVAEIREQERRRKHSSIWIYERELHYTLSRVPLEGFVTCCANEHTQSGGVEIVWLAAQTIQHTTTAVRSLNMRYPTSAEFSSISLLDHVESGIEHEGASDHDSAIHQEDSPPSSAIINSFTSHKYNGNTFFERHGGDIEIMVNGSRFETHRYLLQRFHSLEKLLCGHPPNTPLYLHDSKHDAGDFYNTFKILYATIIEGPFKFDKGTLVSALRIATIYGYPALREYTIGQLECIQLTAVERIKFAREFNLSPWEEPAYVELCERVGPITREEARALGVDMFVRVVEIREREQRRQGAKSAQLTGVAVEKEDGHPAGAPLAGYFGRLEPAGDPPRLAGVELPPAPSFTPNYVSRTGEGGTAEESDDNAIPEHKSVQSFIDAQTGVYSQQQLLHLEHQTLVVVPQCDCRSWTTWRNGGPTKAIPNRCSLSPCAIAAIKDLRAQQLTNANDILALKSSLSELAAFTPPLLEAAPNSVRLLSVNSSIRQEVRAMLSTLRG